MEIDIWALLSDVVLLLSACLVMGGVFSRLGQSPLVGYLLAGMFLGGPGSLHLVKSEHEIEAIAELGVSLLLFSLGLEFSISRLRKLGPVPLVGGVLQVVLTLLAAAGMAYLFGYGPGEATAIGAMVALSSTAVVLRTLMERHELETPYGSNALGVLLIQDIAVVPLAILISLLAGGDDTGSVITNIGRVLAVASGLIVGLYLLLNVVAYYALSALELARNRELTILLSAVTGLGSAWAAHKAGISPALGAFVAGMFLGSSPYATQVRADISPLRVLLLTLFFGSAGMIADPVWIVQNALMLFIAVAVLLTLKFVIITLIFLCFQNLLQTSLATAVCLSQVGEFAFVLGRIAGDAGVITEATLNLFVSVTIVSLFLSPFLVAKSNRIARWILKLFPKAITNTSRTSQIVTPQPDVLIVGFGPAGQIAGRAAVERNLVTMVIDINRSNIRKAGQLGMHGQVGDASQFDVLEHSHISSVKVVVITLPNVRSTIAISDIIRQLAPQAHIIVRSRYQRDTDEILSSGADIVFGDELEVGQQIGNHLCDWISSYQRKQNPDVMPPTIE